MTSLISFVGPAWDYWYLCFLIILSEDMKCSSGPFILFDPEYFPCVYKVTEYSFACVLACTRKHFLKTRSVSTKAKPKAQGTSKTTKRTKQSSNQQSTPSPLLRKLIVYQNTLKHVWDFLQHRHECKHELGHVEAKAWLPREDRRIDLVEVSKFSLCPSLLPSAALI